MPVSPPGYATHPYRAQQGGFRTSQGVQRPVTRTVDPIVVDVSDNEEERQDQAEEAVTRRVPAPNALPAAARTNASSVHASPSPWPHPAFPPNPFASMLPSTHPAHMGPLMPWGDGGWDPFGFHRQSMLPGFFSPFSLAAPQPNAFATPPWPTDDMVAGNGGFHSSSVMVMSSSRGADGQWQVEKYARSSLGHTGHQMHEVKEAYSNSASQTEKMAISRQLGTRGRRVQREHDRRTEEIITTDEVVGIDRTEPSVEAFEADWRRTASTAFPSGRAAVLGTPHRSHSSGVPQRAALLAGELGPAPQQHHARPGALSHPPARNHHAAS